MSRLRVRGNRGAADARSGSFSAEIKPLLAAAIGYTPKTEAKSGYQYLLRLGFVG